MLHLKDGITSLTQLPSAVANLLHRNGCSTTFSQLAYGVTSSCAESVFNFFVKGKEGAATFLERATSVLQARSWITLNPYVTLSIAHRKSHLRIFTFAATRHLSRCLSCRLYRGNCLCRCLGCRLWTVGSSEAASMRRLQFALQC